jgi:hypothetical protein
VTINVDQQAGPQIGRAEIGWQGAADLAGGSNAGSAFNGRAAFLGRRFRRKAGLACASQQGRRNAR